jgi:hypothetical protein
VDPTETPFPQGWTQRSRPSPRGGFSFWWRKRLPSTSYRCPTHPGTVAVSAAASSIEISVWLSSRQDVSPGGLQPWEDYDESLVYGCCNPRRLLLWGFPGTGESACNWQCWNDGHRGPYLRARTDLWSMDQSQSRPVRQSMPVAELSVTDPDDIGERSDKAASSRSRLAPREERSYLAAAICLSHNPVPARSFPVQSEEC